MVIGFENIKSNKKGACFQGFTLKQEKHLLQRFKTTMIRPMMGMHGGILEVQQRRLYYHS